MGDYLKARLTERSTQHGIALLVVLAAKLVFPEAALLIDAAAAVIGVSTVATPDKAGPFPR